jgi:AAA domain-containing protein
MTKPALTAHDREVIEAAAADKKSGRVFARIMDGETVANGRRDQLIEAFIDHVLAHGAEDSGSITRILQTADLIEVVYPPDFSLARAAFERPNRGPKAALGRFGNELVQGPITEPIGAPLQQPIGAPTHMEDASSSSSFVDQTDAEEDPSTAAFLANMRARQAARANDDNLEDRRTKESFDDEAAYIARMRYTPHDEWRDEKWCEIDFDGNAEPSDNSPGPLEYELPGAPPSPFSVEETEWEREWRASHVKLVAFYRDHPDPSQAERGAAHDVHEAELLALKKKFHGTAFTDAGTRWFVPDDTVRENFTTPKAGPDAKKSVETFTPGDIGREAKRRANLDHVIATAEGKDENAGRWGVIDIAPYLDPNRPRLQATIFPRFDDGVCLFYRGKVHWISGEPESGKSLLAQVGCAIELAAGNSVLYIDFEDDAESVVKRVAMFGVTDEQMIKGFGYVAPDSAINPRYRDRLTPLLSIAADASIIVLDGLNDAMGSSGYDPNSSRDFYEWWGVVAKPLLLAASEHAAIIVIDHVVKDKEKRGQWPSGTGQKLAKAHVHYGFNLYKPFGICMTGRAYIRLLKDKPGGNKSHGGPWKQGEGQSFASFTVQSARIKTRAGERIETKVALISDGTVRGEFRPTILMERVSDYLSLPTTNIPASKTGIEGGVKGKAEDIRKALDVLVEEKFVAVNKDKKWPTFTVLKPYKVDEDPKGRTSANPNEFLLTADEVSGQFPQETNS